MPPGPSDRVPVADRRQHVEPGFRARFGRSRLNPHRVVVNRPTFHCQFFTGAKVCFGAMCALIKVPNWQIRQPWLATHPFAKFLPLWARRCCWRAWEVARAALSCSRPRSMGFPSRRRRRRPCRRRYSALRSRDRQSLRPACRALSVSCTV